MSTTSGSPTAVPFRPGSWDVSALVALYVIESGDTMFGLAERYLGAGSRWPEIRAAQGSGGQSKWGKLVPRDGTQWYPGQGCTDTLYIDENGNETTTLACPPPYAPGQVLRMPEEARGRMLAMLSSGEPRSIPSQNNAPGNYPGANPLEPYGLGAPPVVEPPGQPEPKPQKSGGGAGLLVLAAAAAAAVLS